MFTVTVVFAVVVTVVPPEPAETPTPNVPFIRSGAWPCTVQS
jgi:hypothetical protein